jgi:hypothetical protein
LAHSAESGIDEPAATYRHEREASDVQPQGSDTPVQPASDAVAKPTSFLDAVCSVIVQAAVTNQLPAEFFTRLIWQESRFNPHARSYKGAEGIAQFMPGTARWRGLADSYEPFQSLRESARWLAELREQFGNLGLAAAAYNAGPGRVQAWLSGHAALPRETQHYVRVITGRSVDEWSQRRGDDESTTQESVPCIDIAKAFASSNPRTQLAGRSNASSNPATIGPWGLQLIGDWSEDRALTDYRKLQGRFPTILGDRQPLVLRSRMAGRGSAVWYLIRVAESSRQRATELCNKLEAAGGKCLVFRN